MLRSMGSVSAGGSVPRVMGHGGSSSGWMDGRAERGVRSSEASLLKRLVLRGNGPGADARAWAECRRVIH